MTKHLQAIEYYRLPAASSKMMVTSACGAEKALITVHFATQSLMPPAYVRNPAIVTYWYAAKLRLMKNPDFGICAVHLNGDLAHVSKFIPGSFRFPFMAKNDLQIMGTWTSPSYRGKKLARLAIAAIVRSTERQERDYWYLIEPDNDASRRVALATGFEFVGSGNRMSKFGLKALGHYQLANAQTHGHQ